MNVNKTKIPPLRWNPEPDDASLVLILNAVKNGLVTSTYKNSTERRYGIRSEELQERARKSRIAAAASNAPGQLPTLDERYESPRQRLLRIKNERMGKPYMKQRPSYTKYNQVSKRLRKSKQAKKMSFGLQKPQLQVSKNETKQTVLKKHEKGQKNLKTEQIQGFQNAPTHFEDPDLDALSKLVFERRIREEKMQREIARKKRAEEARERRRRMRGPPTLGVPPPTYRKIPRSNKPEWLVPRRKPFIAKHYVEAPNQRMLVGKGDFATLPLPIAPLGR